MIDTYEFSYINCNNPLSLDSPDKAKRAKTEYEQPSGTTGFDRGLEAEYIIGANEICGRKFLLIKYKDVEQPEMVPATVAHKKITQMVIDFYESRLVWASSDSEDEEPRKKTPKPTKRKN